MCMKIGTLLFLSIYSLRLCVLHFLGPYDTLLCVLIIIYSWLLGYKVSTVAMYNLFKNSLAVKKNVALFKMASVKKAVKSKGAAKKWL